MTSVSKIAHALQLTKIAAMCVLMATASAHATPAADNANALALTKSGMTTTNGWMNGWTNGWSTPNGWDSSNGWNSNNGWNSSNGWGTANGWATPNGWGSSNGLDGRNGFDGQNGLKEGGHPTATELPTLQQLARAPLAQ